MRSLKKNQRRKGFQKETRTNLTYSRNWKKTGIIRTKEEEDTCTREYQRSRPESEHSGLCYSTDLFLGGDSNKGSYTGR